MMSIIEHVVLFKIKEDATQSQIDSMVDRVNSLVSLKETLHLNMVTIQSSSSSSSFSSSSFTHILHIRFTSKEDLHAYAIHPTHLEVIKVNAPLVSDIMAVDWVTEVDGNDLVLPYGSAVRVLFFKLKEGLSEQVKDEVLKGISGIRHENAVQFTCGENFSPARAKGFSFATLEVFTGLSELKEVDYDEEFRKYDVNDKIKENLDNVLVLDFVANGQIAS
ncbi:stress responsive A/B barrel domain protein [Trifolium pratense]|uniref:Stress responsive A/B barrel domain protein n=1 Tax=Trifolium pratense TaxID=57577 RepID=A0A2K3LRW0_TRIPR|nr:stress responsive A/B barrel domain protein [Trifolium pratense]